MSFNLSCQASWRKAIKQKRVLPFRIPLNPAAPGWCAWQVDSWAADLVLLCFCFFWALTQSRAGLAYDETGPLAPSCPLILSLASAYSLPKHIDRANLRQAVLSYAFWRLRGTLHMQRACKSAAVITPSN